jgi:NlpE N-terminal domain
MRAAASLTLPGCLLALCGLLPAALAYAQNHGSTPTAAALHAVVFASRQADLAGTYQGHAPAADAAKRIFTLSLAADGTAILDTLYIGKDSVTQHGRWLQSGSQIILTFDPMGANGPPRPITFRHRDHELSPVRWDPSEWGRAGPPVLHRARAKAISTWIPSAPSAAALRLAHGGN